MSAAAPALAPAERHWFGHAYVIGCLIVGVIELEPATQWWQADGCWDDWRDVDLERHRSLSKARKAIELWVERMEAEHGPLVVVGRAA